MLRFIIKRAMFRLACGIAIALLLALILAVEWVGKEYGVTVFFVAPAIGTF